MNWNEFYQSLKNDDLRPVYLFTGPEVYIKADALEALRAKLLPAGLEGLNEAILEGVDASQIIEAAETLPVMCDRRLVVVRDWAPLLSAKSRNEEEEVKRISEWLKNAPDTCSLVFYMRGNPDGKKKLTTLLNREAEVVRFDPLTDPELNQWVGQRLRPLKKKMSAAAVAQLAFTAGRELTRLSGELEKLVAYVGDRGEITAADIQALVTPSLEYSVFEMLDKLLMGDIAEAQKLMNASVERGESRIGILAMLTRQFRSLTHMKLAMENGSTADSIEKLFKLNHYAATKMARQARSFSVQRLTALYRDLIETDYAIKSGQLREQAAVDLIFLKIGMEKLG